MSDSVDLRDFTFVAQVVWQNWAHHVGVPWEDRVGEWCVFPMGTVPYGWPGGGARLALELTAAEMEKLRLSSPADAPPITPQPLPGAVPPPAPIPADSEPEFN